VSQVVTGTPLTHVLLQPVLNPTPTVCHNAGPASSDDVIIADQWRRSLIIDSNEPHVSVVSLIFVAFPNADYVT